MKLLKIFWLIVGMVILAAVGVTLFDPHYGQLWQGRGDSVSIEEGKAVYLKRACDTCHGTTGNDPIAENYPKIGGQSESYIRRQITDIKSGARANGSSSLMQPATLELTEEEIDLIAIYLNRQKP